MRYGWPTNPTTPSKLGRPRATRYPFRASVVLIDLESGRTTVEKTGNLSLFGCLVVPGDVSPLGTRVRLQITHNGQAFEALGRVANTRPVEGIGIAFIKVEDHHQLVLEKWLAGLRSEHGHPASQRTHRVPHSARFTMSELE